MKIYKYAKLENAIEMVSKNRLKLSNPASFNDPFDTNVKRDKEDIRITSEITFNSSRAMHLMQCLELPGMKDALRRNPLFFQAKQEFFYHIEKLKKDPYYPISFDHDSLYKFFNMDKSHFNDIASNEARQFEQNIKNQTEATINDALVTCFSKNHASLLMWAHYADSHKGVCIEYDRPESNDFVDVIYSERRPKLKLESLTRYVAAVSMVGKEYSQEIQSKMFLDSMSPFITKSNEWAYEQEVRCLITKTGYNVNLVKEKDEYFYKMPLPSKIYIGCRCKGKELTQLLKLTSKAGIKVIFYKTDKNTYSLIEK